MGRVGEWLRKSLLYHPIALCQLPNSLTPTLSPTGGDGKVVDFYRAMCPPLEGGSGRGLTKLLEVVQHIWDSGVFFHERHGLMGGPGRMAAGGRQTCHSTVC